MTRSIPWPRILAEGIAIVVSILLAFGIQAWWEGAQEAELESSILAAVESEVASNKERLLRDIETIRAQQQRRDFFLRAAPERLAAVPQDSVSPILDALMGAGPTYDPVSGSASLLAQTAVLSPAGVEIRSLVSDWLRQVADMQEEREQFNDRTQDVQGMLAPYAARAASEETTSLNPMVSSLGPSVLGEIRLDEELIAQVVRRASVQAVYLRQLRRLSEALDSLAFSLDSR